LHDVRQPLGRSVFFSYGRMASLANVAELPISMPRVAEMRLEDLDEQMRTVRRIEAPKDAIGRMATNPWNDLRMESWKAGDEALIEASLRELGSNVALVKVRSLALSNLIGVDRARSLSETRRLMDVLDRAASTPYPPEAWLAAGRPDALLAQMERMRSFYQAIDSDSAWAAKTYSSEIGHEDTAGMLSRFEDEYRSPLRSLNGSFKKDLFQLQSLVRDGRWLKYKDALDDLQRIEGWKKNRQKREELEQRSSEDIGLRFKGENTDWNELRSCLLWCSAFVRDFKDLLNERTTAMICRPQGGANSVQPPVTEAAEAMQRFQLSMDAVKDWFQLTDMQTIPRSVAYDRYDDFVTSHLSSLPLLKERVEVAALEKASAERGLGEVFELARKGILPKENLTQSYEKRFYRVWLDQIASADERLRDFHSDEHSETIEQFRKLDKEQMTSAQ
jgi:hypothetical protein